MKKKVEKKLLGVVKKVVDAGVYRERYGEGPPYCPVIFHQPKRPEKIKRKIVSNGI